MKKIIIATFLALISSFSVSDTTVVPPGCGEYMGKNHLVYTRQPRLTAPLTYTPWGTTTKKTLEESSQLQDYYDGGEPDNFTTADLVYDDREGNITVLYDCTTGNKMCAAHDARVSPDATKVVFTVARGTNYEGILNNVYGIVWRATSYELWIHDFKTKLNTKIDGNARSADWCGDDCLVFASNRAGIYPPWANVGPDYTATGHDRKAKGLHIYRAYLNSTLKLGPALDIIPHAVSCISPSVNLDGTIQASCWNGFGDRSYAHTPMNMWWIEQYNGNGGGHRVIMGAHGSPIWDKKSKLTGVCQAAYCGEGGTMFRVLKNQVQLRGNKFAIANYYRGNHQGGMGTIFICNNSPTEGFSYAKNLPGLEAPQRTGPGSLIAGSGRFAPNCYVATPYGNDQDMHVLMHVNGKAMGKAGYPFVAPQIEGLYGFTHCRGNCYSATEAEADYKRATFGGEPTSKREIRIALVPVITDPFDPAQSKVIACADEKWNCFDARFVNTYQVLYGQPAPAKSKPQHIGTTSTLNVVNSKEGEIHKIPGAAPYNDCALQGCADANWKETIAAVKVTEILPWKEWPPRKGFYQTNIVGVYPLEADGSVSITFDRCGFTYQFEGVNAAGVTVTKDNSLHSAICGETVTCHGCHDAHSEERRALYIPSPEDRFKETMAFKKLMNQ